MGGAGNDFIYDKEKAQLIGNGAYGEVKKAVYIPDNEEAAIKIIKLDNHIDKKERENYIDKIKRRISEIDKFLIGNDFGNKNFTKYYEKICEKKDKTKLYFGMELCNFNISTYMQKNYTNEIDIGNIYDILVQLNNNFNIMKNKEIVHGNIKLENILVSGNENNYIFKLSGFEIIPELIKKVKLDRPEKICKYLPPELLENNTKFEIDQKTDLWSLGVIIYYLAFKEFPFDGESPEDVLNNINQNNRKRTNFIELDDLIDKLLKVDKNERLTWDQYLNHPFFKGNGFFKEYIINEKIGEGQFTIVYKATDKVNKQNVAIKIFDFDKIDEIESNKNIKNDIITQIKQRIDKMKRLYSNNHNCIIEIYKEFITDNYIAFSMELGEMNLIKYIENFSEEQLKASKIFYFLVELNKSLKFLVRNNNEIIGNLKLENIILKKKNESSNEYIYKLSDVGLCIGLLKLIKRSSNRPDILCYIPPELNTNENYENISDLWNLGIIIHYFRFKRYPYVADSFSEIISQLNNGTKKIGNSKNPDLNSLIEGLLEKDIKKRLNWEQYFHHLFFTNRDYKRYYELSNKPMSESAYYSIYKAKEKKTNKDMIIKIVDKEEIRKKYKKIHLVPIDEIIIKDLVEKLVDQTVIMKDLEQEGKNQNTVKFYEYFNTQNDFAIVMEKCDGDLNRYFIKRKENFSFEEIKELLSQLNNTFQIMAKNNIIHGDLTLENILFIKVNNKIVYKLTDYGVSREFLNLTEKLLEKNTPKFTAPEILKGDNFDINSDLWSLGVMIYFLLFRDYPYKGRNNKEVLSNILNSKNKLQLSNNPQLDYLIRKLLTVNPNDRFSWEQYFVNPFLVGGDCWKYFILLENKFEGPFFRVDKVKLRYNSTDKEEYRGVKRYNLGIIKKELEKEIGRECTNDDLKPYIEDFIKENENMELLRGPNKDNINTVLFYEYFQTENEFCSVQELCDGNLNDFIVKKKEKKERFSVRGIYKILSQLNNTFRILKDNNLSHKDLILNKILLKKNNKGEDYIYKLTGHEFNRQADNLLGNWGVVGDLKYKAPEILNNEIPIEPTKEISQEEFNRLHQKADLWSLGIIIFILYFLEFPYKGNKQDEIYNSIRQDDKSRLNEVNDNDLKDLLKQLLHEDRNERIDWDGYFKHKFFSQEKWGIYSSKHRKNGK